MRSCSWHNDCCIGSCEVECFHLATNRQQLSGPSEVPNMPRTEFSAELRRTALYLRLSLRFALWTVLNRYRLQGMICLVVLMTPDFCFAVEDFTRTVFPILQRHCLECHGSKKQEADLRLDSAKSVEAAGVIVTGEPDGSELIRRIVLSADDPEFMPAKGKPLSPTEQNVLRRWIAAGARWPAEFTPPAHWAYVPPASPPVPDGAADWGATPVDRFVLEHLSSVGLKPSGTAKPFELLRRVHLDLNGLPPTPQEVQEFCADPSDDRYAGVVDDLLSRPQFGEKWARHWLDLARYADSHGFQRDDLRDNWAWRDWVIRAMNDDMPFDQFTIEQIAGDLLPNAAQSQRIATGFHRCSPTNCEAGSLPEETRTEQLIDRVNTTATIWLGTTLECAQCHDHKYDPVTITDYYRLLAYFNNTALEADLTNPKQPSSIAFQGPSMAISDPELDAKRQEITDRLKDLESQLSQRRQELLNDLDTLASAVSSELFDSPDNVLLDVTSFQSQGNTDEYEVLDDGSILLKGNDPPAIDVYELVLTAPTDLKNIRGIRLDALTHETLPGTGPGRGDPQRTNFILNEFSCALSGPDGTELQPLVFSEATADFSQKGWDVAGAIDGKAKSGWAIGPQFRQPHWAVFHLKVPITIPAGTRLRFQLLQRFGNARTLGRFRISAVTRIPDNSSTSTDPAIAKVLQRPSSEWTPEDRERLLTFRSDQDKTYSSIQRKISAQRKQLEQLSPETTLVMVEQTRRESYVFIRGDYKSKGDTVEPGTPEFLHAAPAGPANRLTLARWLVDRRNPLVARVTVNRWWAELFGQGLVGTPEDFGLKGDTPSHPELLDWLSVEFMNSGWSMKHILRTMVLSETYRQSSRTLPQHIDADPPNRWLARGPRFRMDAEMIRDNALAVAGLLNPKQFGPPIRPVQPDGLWAKVGGQQYEYLPSEGDEQHRRGIYVVHKRSAPNPSLVNFDASARLTCTVRRSRTNTPLQALTLLNDPVFVEASRAMTHRILRQLPDAEFSERLDYAFLLSLARRPHESERNALKSLFEAQLEEFASRSTTKLPGADATGLKVSPHELSAWYSITTVLLNLHETITKP
jgi:hypothetical protein